MKMNAFHPDILLFYVFGIDIEPHWRLSFVKKKPAKNPKDYIIELIFSFAFLGRHGVPFCSVWDGMGDRGAGYKVAISNVFAAFILPLIIIAYPFIALLMQICGGRMPR